MPTRERYDRLRDTLASYEGGLLVAYSGGIDSTLLAVVAHEVLGPRTVAALASSETFPAHEAEAARALAQHLHLDLVEVHTDEIADPLFRANTPDRCYHCKTELFGVLRQEADARGLALIADGSNADDLADHRPGRRAAAELGIVSPLQHAGLTKDDIRSLARDLGLPNWDKPSMACLASRFPYGDEITAEKIARVARAEAVLRVAGVARFRVRAHGDVARIEVDPSEAELAWAARQVVSEGVKQAGFAYVTLDLDGYRTGSMNEVLTADERASGE